MSGDPRLGPVVPPPRHEKVLDLPSPDQLLVTAKGVVSTAATGPRNDDGGGSGFDQVLLTYATPIILLPSVDGRKEMAVDMGIPSHWFRTAGTGSLGRLSAALHSVPHTVTGCPCTRATAGVNP